MGGLNIKKENGVEECWAKMAHEEMHFYNFVINIFYRDFFLHSSYIL